MIKPKLTKEEARLIEQCGREYEEASFALWKKKFQHELDPSWSKKTLKKMYDAWNESENYKRRWGEE